MENGSRLCCRTLAGATWTALPAHVRCHKVHHGQNEETAKAEYLSKLVYREGDRAVDVLSQAKRAGVGGTRNRTPWRPMPTLMMQDGNEVGTRRDRDKAWLEYFGEQECGEVIKLDELIHDPMEPLVIDELGMLPSPLLGRGRTCPSTGTMPTGHWARRRTGRDPPLLSRAHVGDLTAFDGGQHPPRVPHGRQEARPSSHAGHVRARPSAKRLSSSL